MSKSTATPEQLQQILQRLGTDDAYREHFLGNPVSALAQHGVTVHPNDVPAVRQLPPKATLMDDNEAVKTQVASQFAVFFATTA